MYLMTDSIGRCIYIYTSGLVVCESACLTDYQLAKTIVHPADCNKYTLHFTQLVTVWTCL